jgi:hypothetical protein
MDQVQVHYELFVRRTPAAPWTLEIASENRAQVVDTAEEMIALGRVAAVRVSKETFDADTHEFQSVAIFSKGKVESEKKRKVVEDREPLCVSPEDLYTVHARDRIGRLLENWLTRNHATPFELLHRADLVEKLDAAGTELQHAIQKIAVPEAQARGASTHELIRSFQALTERAIGRVLGDARKGRFPNLASDGFAKVLEQIAGEPDGDYLLGAAVAASLAESDSWSGKVTRLLDLADQAPAEGPAQRRAFQVLEQPLSEILESRAALVELLGPNLDLGGQLAAMTQLVAHDVITSLSGIEPQVARCLPPLEGAASRLSAWLSKSPFDGARAAVGRRIIRELMGPRRLRPSNPEDEIALLRALGMTLTAAAGQLLPADGVQEAFVARSRMLVTAEFVEALIGRDKLAKDEADLLIWLCENVVGSANKRQAGRYLISQLGSLKFEKELRNGGPDTPAQRLSMLAAMQKSVGRCSLDPSDLAAAQTKLGEVGGLVEADAKLSASLAQASAPIVQRLTLLLRLATGDGAPAGPAAERARAAAMKLLRSDSVRAELAAQPEQLEQVRSIIQAAGLAA